MWWLRVLTSKLMYLQFWNRSDCKTPLFCCNCYQYSNVDRDLNWFRKVWITVSQLFQGMPITWTSIRSRLSQWTWQTERIVWPLSHVTVICEIHTWLSRWQRVWSNGNTVNVRLTLWSQARSTSQTISLNKLE